MKRFCAIVLLFLTVLAGCGGDTVDVVEKGPYDVVVGEELVTVNPVKCTITDDEGNVYTYVVGDSSVTFTYPNGYEYFWNYTSGIGLTGLEGIPDGYRYLDGMTLEAAMEREINPVKKAENPGYILFALVCFIIGGLNIAFPYAGWYLRYGWRFRDAEPSDTALAMNRVSGVLAVVIGIVFLFL